MTLSEGLQEFCYQKRIDGINKNSICTYRRVISLFVRFAGPDREASDLSYNQVADYIISVQDKGISRATQSSYIRNLKIFLRWLDAEERLSFNPLKIKIPKSPKKKVHLYSDAEIKLIFNSVATSVPWITARNKAMIALMLDSGLRQCELIRLRRIDIDRENMVMKVSGKGAKDRMVSLGAISEQLLAKYLALCPFADRQEVFLDRRGNPCSGNAVRLFVYRLQKKLPFELSSHKLRHNYATNYCMDHIERNGQSDVYNLSILMGHESIETTKKYEHFAHEMVAAKGGISHLDCVYDLV